MSFKLRYVEKDVSLHVLYMFHYMLYTFEYQLNNCYYVKNVMNVEKMCVMKFRVILSIC